MIKYNKLKLNIVGLVLLSIMSFVAMASRVSAQSASPTIDIKITPYANKALYHTDDEFVATYTIENNGSVDYDPSVHTSPINIFLQFGSSNTIFGKSGTEVSTSGPVHCDNPIQSTSTSCYIKEEFKSGDKATVTIKKASLSICRTDDQEQSIDGLLTGSASKTDYANTTYQTAPVLSPVTFSYDIIIKKCSDLPKYSVSPGDYTQVSKQGSTDSAGKGSANSVATKVPSTGFSGLTTSLMVILGGLSLAGASILAISKFRR